MADYIPLIVILHVPLFLVIVGAKILRESYRTRCDRCGVFRALAETGETRTPGFGRRQAEVRCMQCCHTDWREIDEFVPTRFP